MGSRDVEDNLPLMLCETGQQRLRDPLVERRVATRQELCAGVVHAGTGEGHVVAAGCIKGSKKTNCHTVLSERAGKGKRSTRTYSGSRS